MYIETTSVYGGKHLTTHACIYMYIRIANLKRVLVAVEVWQLDVHL